MERREMSLPEVLKPKNRVGPSLSRDRGDLTYAAGYRANEAALFCSHRRLVSLPPSILSSNSCILSRDWRVRASTKVIRPRTAAPLSFRSKAKATKKATAVHTTASPARAAPFPVPGEDSVAGPDPGHDFPTHDDEEHDAARRLDDRMPERVGAITTLRPGQCRARGSRVSASLHPAPSIKIVGPTKSKMSHFCLQAAFFTYSTRAAVSGRAPSQEHLQGEDQSAVQDVV